MTREELISNGYLEEQRMLHAAPKSYGGRGAKWAPLVSELAAKHRARSVLDYGCGQGSLAEALRPLWDPASPLFAFMMAEYDPAIAGKEQPPSVRFDLVVCTDVLEHIESDRIHAVFRHLSELTSRALFSVICLVPTSHTLSNGRQAHILIRSVEWWKYQFEEHGFVLSSTVRSEDPNKEHKQLAAVWVRR